MNTKKKNGQSGAALIEFVLVVPLLLLFLFGIIEFSIVLYDKAVITNASREAAREWIEYTETKMGSGDIKKIVNDYAKERLISFGTTTNELDPDYEINDLPVTDTTAYVGGDMLKVIVDYQYDYLLLPAFVNGLLPITLSAETVMRAE